jgi:hypothetical protein
MQKMKLKKKGAKKKFVKKAVKKQSYGGRGTVPPKAQEEEEGWGDVEIVNHM